MSPFLTERRDPSTFPAHVIAGYHVGIKEAEQHRLKQQVFKKLIILGMRTYADSWFEFSLQGNDQGCLVAAPPAFAAAWSHQLLDLTRTFVAGMIPCVQPGLKYSWFFFSPVSFLSSSSFLFFYPFVIFLKI